MGQPYFSNLFFLDEMPATARPKPARHAPMKINMMLHFYACCEAYAPEKCRTSRAYTQFVKELLRDGLIERPTREEREEYPGWAYQATEKGKAWVNAICTVPTPYVTNMAFGPEGANIVFVTGAFEQWKAPFPGAVYRWSR